MTCLGDAQRLRPTQDGFPYEWLVLAHASQLPKSSQKSNSWSQWAPGLPRAAASLDSQLGSAWETPNPPQVAVISDCFITQAGWHWAGHRWVLTLAWTIFPGPLHPVGSYRPRRSTTTLPLHSWSSAEGGGWWSVLTVSPCSWLVWVNPSHWPANSNQGSTTRGRCTQPIWRAHLKHPALVIGKAVSLDPTEHLLY